MNIKLPLLAFAIFLTLSTNAQQPVFTPSFTAITVSNIDSSIHWYKSLFNLRLRNRIDNPNRGFKQAILMNETVMIELVELDKGIAIDTLLAGYPKGTNVYGFYKFGFNVSDVEELFKQLVSRGIPIYGKMVTDPVDKRKTFLIEDPDKNLVQFFGQ